MYNHQCPCCLRGTVPNDYCNTPATEATDFNHKSEHIATTTTAAIGTTICRNEEQRHTHHQYTTPQNRKIPPSNELLQTQQQQEQQSSKYFDVRCQNLAIYSVSDPLQINCCKQENSNCRDICWQQLRLQSDRINQLSSASSSISNTVLSQSANHPSKINNKINCNRCHRCSCYSSAYKCCFTSAALSPDNSYQSDSINNCNNCTIATCSENRNHKIDENSLASSYISNHHDVSSSDSNHRYFSVSNGHTTDNKYEQIICDLAIKSNATSHTNDTSSSSVTTSVIGIERNSKEKKMSSGDNNCSKNKELGTWTEYTELLLGRRNNCKKRNLRIGSTTKSTTAAITSIFSSVFLLITLLPSFTLAGGEYLHKFYLTFFFENIAGISSNPEIEWVGSEALNHKIT